MSVNECLGLINLMSQIGLCVIEYCFVDDV